MNVVDLPQALRRLRLEAIQWGVHIERGEAIIPLVAFHKPGVFGVVRSLYKPLRCPECGSDAIERHGIRKGAFSRQQFHCINKEGCGAGDGQRANPGRIFSEYHGTVLEGSPRSAAEWLAALHWYTAGRGQPLQARRRIVDRLGCSKRTVARYIQIMNRMIAEPRWKGIASGRTSYQIMCTFTNDIPPNLLDGRIEPIGGLSSNQLDNLRLVLRNRRPVSADALEGISRDSNPTANPSTEAHDAVRDDQTDPSCEVSDDQPWERNDDNQ